MITPGSNADLNLSPLKINKQVFEFHEITHTTKFLDYLEWLLPYKVENKSQFIDHATNKISEDGCVIISLDFFHFREDIGHATRIDLSINFVNENKKAVIWNDFVHPLFKESDRSKDSLSVQGKIALKSIVNAYDFG